MSRYIFLDRLLVGVLFLLMFSVLFFPTQIVAETDMDTAIAKSEKFITADAYYQAILALEPLLMSEEKNEAQEEALWLAHQLAKKCVPVMQEEYGYSETLWKVKTSEKTRRLNQIVKGQFWDFAMYYYDYGYGFLQRLIDEHPNTSKRPIAEYYLIQKGAVVLGYDAETIQAYHAYIEKYEKTGRAEVYMAYLDLAHIYHGIWAALTFPKESSAGMWAGFGYDSDYSSEDPEQEKATAAAHKTEALKYYARFHINPHGLLDNSDYAFYGFNDETGYELLKKNAIFGWQFILYGC